jgi:hypothetical protein
MMYKGKDYPIQVGAKGGKFFIDDSGKKHYIKENSPKKKKEEKKPHRYICYYYIVKDGERIDDYKEWCTAYSYMEAEQYFKREHPKDEIGLITRSDD